MCDCTFFPCMSVKPVRISPVGVICMKTKVKDPLWHRKNVHVGVSDFSDPNWSHSPSPFLCSDFYVTILDSTKNLGIKMISTKKIYLLFNIEVTLNLFPFWSASKITRREQILFLRKYMHYIIDVRTNYRSNGIVEKLRKLLIIPTT